MADAGNSYAPDQPERPRAAQYLRMSTDQQVHSFHHQTLAITTYAINAGYEVVRTYEDPGQSGLTIHNRPGLKSLLADVLSGHADFSLILVYDVSRWGRFPDPDQAAHYEFLCREAGVAVEYVGEHFRNDGSMTSSLMKTMKRAMAAEYSRELSVKTSYYKKITAAKGYWTGGLAPYGYRRRALRPDGGLRPAMERGEQKGVMGDRTLLVLGPPLEVATVKRVFSERLKGRSLTALVAGLNADGIAAPKGGCWYTSTLRWLLMNEIYLGNLVIGKTTYQRGKRYLDRSLELARADDAFPGIISRTTFDRVRATLWTYSKGKSSEQMLIELAAAYRRHGRLSQSIVKTDPNCSSTYVYRARFGSMEEAYRLVGFTMAESDKARSDRIRLRQAGKAKKRRSNLPGEQMAIRFTDDTHLIQGAPNLPTAFDGLADKVEPKA